MSYNESTFTLPAGNRAVKRNALISCFLREDAGNGNGSDASRYCYYVEAFGRYRIFLKRPTQLNKGFDFTVNVEGLYFKKNRKYSNPSHEDIVKALSDCKSKYPDDYSIIKAAIDEIYNCNDVDMTSIHATFFDADGNEHPIQVILLAIKWLFMEQDCAYWNYSGRRMLYEFLAESELV